AEQKRRTVRNEGPQLVARLIPLAGKTLGEVARVPRRAAAGAAEPHRHDPERYRRGHPRRPEADSEVADECEPEYESPQRAADRERHGGSRRSQQQRDLARTLSAKSGELEDPRGDRARDEDERREEVQEEKGVRHPIRSLRAVEDGCDNRSVDVRERHLRLLTETIEAVNSTLDLEEVLALVARKVADALGGDACVVYLCDERTAERGRRGT